MKRGMVDSNYLEELLEGIPDGLFDGNYSEEDLLKMVDLPMESFANDVPQAEFDVNETQAPWAGAYVGYRPVDSAVWDTVPEQKPELIPSNSSVPVPEPILSDASVGLPSVVGDNGMEHVNGSTVSDTFVEVKPMTMPLNGSIMNPGLIPSYGSVGLPTVVGGQVRTGGNAGSGAMEPQPMITPLNGLISETEPIPSVAPFGLLRVVEDNVINHTTRSAVSDTVLESKPKVIPSNSLANKSRPMMVDAMIGSRVVVERQVSENTVGGKAHTNILPKRKPEITADGKAKVVESGSSRIHSPVSVLDTSSCNSAQTSMSNIKSRGARFGKRSKRARPEQIKTPWFHITLLPRKTCTNKTKEKRQTSQDSVLRRTTTESKLFDFPACWKKQTTAPRGGGTGGVGMKKCTHCEVTKTPQWREGPNGPKTLCNACGVRYRSGRLFPEYRPAASPTFTPYLHSNSHRKVVEMRKRHGTPPRRENKVIDLTEQDLQGANTGMNPPRSPDSPLIENIPMMGHPFELIY